jgi:hypothetical protein
MPTGALSLESICVADRLSGVAASVAVPEASTVAADASATVSARPFLQ